MSVVDVPELWRIRVMTWQSWLLLPCVAAVIGWFTNFVAVRMIFRPRRAFRLGFLTLQGVLPKRRREFAESIGETVEEHLVNAGDVKELLAQPAIAEELREAVLRRVDAFFQERLMSLNPMLAGFLKGPFLDKLKASLVEEVGGLMGEGVELLCGHLDDNLDTKKLVEDKLMGFDMDKLEAIVLRVARKELRTIEALGAVLGFMVGVVQLLVLEAFLD